MTGIIILNWNGWKDTIECLKSLYACEGEEFFVVLADNGSTNESVEKIREFIKSDGQYPYFEYSEGNISAGLVKTGEIKNKTVILYKLNENYGFAKGNNKGLELARLFSPEFYMLLNNDTEVMPDFLTELVHFADSHREYSILTPKISFYFNKNLIWNCGGKLIWGFRKYYYAGKPESEIKEKESIRISFITGCALFFRPEIIEKGKLLTERFFHGEEDFEFSYRMGRQKIKMACVLSSHIFHKVGMATQSLKRIGKSYAHYLNRFVNMRTQMPSISYYFWKNVYSPYIYLLLRRQGQSRQVVFNFIRQLRKESSEIDEVPKERFFQLLEKGI